MNKTIDNDYSHNMDELLNYLCREIDSRHELAIANIRHQDRYKREKQAEKSYRNMFLAAQHYRLAVIPEGYALVPVEPTSHMIYAGVENTDLEDFCTSSRQSRHHDIAGQVYKAMINAAILGESE